MAQPEVPGFSPLDKSWYHCRIRTRPIEAPRDAISRTQAPAVVQAWPLKWCNNQPFRSSPRKEKVLF
ncbi:hypothetical protein LIA77_04837 [Sarocladium implicatum]|nr:hypothetical protein LIA77_04837 [Sarocladium implicatum]